MVCQAVLLKRRGLNLEDTDWILVSYGEQGDLQAVIPGSEITALFESAKGKIKGSAGCNSYFGGYTVSENRLTVSSQLGMTTMA